MRTHIGPYKLANPEEPFLGGMARVYKAKHPELPLDFAIKEPLPEYATPEFLSVFNREAERTAQLKHDNIVEVHDSGLTEDPPYLVLEWLPDSLYQVLEEQDQIPWRRGVRYAIQVCDALQFAHSQKPALIHQDVKPDNLRLTRQGNIKVADFGLSLALRSTPSFSAMAMWGSGTPEYMAPEQWREEEVDGRADIYALGITLFECIAGHKPFEGNVFALGKMHESQPLPEFPEEVNAPQAVRAVILRATAKDREDRYQTAAAMGDALKGLEGGLGTDVRAMLKSLESDQWKIKEDLEDNQRKISDLLKSFESDQHHRRLDARDEEQIPEPEGFITPAYYLRLGEEHLESREFRKAADVFSEMLNDGSLVTDDKAYYRAYQASGEAYVGLEEYGAAIRHFGDAIELRPDEAYNYRLRGQAYLALDLPEEMVLDYTRALELDPEEPSNWLLYLAMGRAHMGLEYHQSAVNDITQSLQISPFGVRELEEYDHFTVGVPERLDSYFIRGQAFRGLGELEKAITDYTEAIELANTDMAISEYGDVKEIDHTTAMIYGARAYVYQQLGKVTSAVEDQTAYLALIRDPVGPDYADRASMYLEMDEYEKAIDDLKILVAMDPEEGNYYWLAKVCAECGMYEAAAEHFTEVIKRVDFPKVALAYTARARAYLLLGEYQKAVDDFTIAIDTPNPGNFTALLVPFWGRGSAYKSLGEFQNAIDDFTTIIEEIDPGHGEPYQTRDAYQERGVLYGETGELERAITDLNEAVRLRSVETGSAMPDLDLEAEVPADPVSIGRYEIRSIVAEGGISKVYEAFDTALNRPVAIRVAPSWAKEDPVYTDLIMNEQRLLATLSHENIVVAYELGVHDGLAYSVLEYVPDRISLHLRGEGRPIEQREAAGIAAQLCSALVCIHQVGIIHGDIKPSNILLTEDMVPKLTGFSLAKIMDGFSSPASLESADSYQLDGTFSYMAPELMRGDPIDGRSDIYALGVTLFELLTGGLPYPGETPVEIFKQKNGPPGRMPESSGVYPDLEAIVNKALSTNVKDRFSDAAEMGAELSRALVIPRSRFL